MTILIESILNGSDEGEIQKLTGSLMSIIDEAVESATVEEIATLLPLAKRSILSPRAKVRTPGLSLLLAVRFRQDSASLLEPYVDDIGSLLKDPDQATRNAAILLLNGARPSPSPKALRYLLAHVNDKNVLPMEIAGAAGGLLAPSRPIDPAILHNILSVVQERRDRSLTIAILQTVGLYQITQQEAENFLKSGLIDSDHFVRHAAVEAAGRMSPDIRQRFIADVSRIAVNPEETPENRALAERVVRP